MSNRKIKGTIHWVSAIYNKEILVREYEDLFNEDNFEIIKSKINESIAVAEINIDTCEVTKPVKFMRNGYYTLDSDGSFIKEVSLKEGFKLDKIISV